MSTETQMKPKTVRHGFEPLNVNVRIKISALWTAMLFVFAYVDIFSLFRPDFRADVEAGVVGGFTVNQTFLLVTTIYIVIPSLMVFGALVLRPRINRIVNIALSIIYAITIIAGMVGEWSYYLLGSAIEVALLAAIVHYARTWPKVNPFMLDHGPEDTRVTHQAITRTSVKMAASATAWDTMASGGPAIELAQSKAMPR